MQTKQSPHLYLIGAAGAGMAWIIDYALAQGWQVSGSEVAENSRVAELRVRGVEVVVPPAPEKIPETVTEGIMTSAVREGSPSFAEAQALKARKVPVVKRAVWIGGITKRYRTIAVAGTHGKTTTTAMVGWILDKAGLDPTVFTGGAVAAWGNTTRIGQGEFLVIEADEFDRSFHNFYPEMAILLNIDADHLDYYTGGLPEIEQSFRRFLRNIPAGGKGLVAGYGRDASIRKVCRGFSHRFRWYDEKSLWPGLRLPVPGEHMKLNATAAARIAHELGVSQETILEALATFPGVARRFEPLGKWGKADLYDDYAHHPRELLATIGGIKQRFADEPIAVVFQPHQKQRTSLLLKEFGKAFPLAKEDELVIAPIYEVAGREEDFAVTNQDVKAEIEKNRPDLQVYAPADNEALGAWLKDRSVRPGVVVTMGAGSLRDLVAQWRSESHT